MRTVLIAHRDAAIADALEADLRREGYHVNTCPGPFPPALRCIQCDTGYCPLTDAADVLIYDPTLMGLGAGGTYQNLAVESARAHLDIPMLVTTFTEGEAGAAPRVMARADNIVVAAEDRSELLLQVNQLVARATDVASTCSTGRPDGR